jgi:LCP family protein required for cell wall assembly
MKQKLRARALILPLLIAFMLLVPLVFAAVIGEHRYERRHPAYLQHFWMRLLGEEEAADGDGNIATLAEQKERINVLVLGKDRVAGLTDVMMLASLDTKNHTLQLLQIPRDTYAAYTKGAYKKLNGAYAKLGGSGVTSFLRDNMGVNVDHYVCIDLQVLGEMVDMMGGVRMNVPSNMDYDDPTQDLHIHLKAGEQLLDGKTAQMFVRFRSGYALADVGRMDAQKLFLSALAKQAKENLSLAQTVNLVCSCFGKIKTDMGLNDCIGCAKALRQVELSDMHMATLPGASARTGGDSGAWYYILNRAATAQMLERTVGGNSSSFDLREVFTDRSKAAFDSIYRAAAERCKTKDYTAEGTLGGELDIRRVS